ncbi:DUF924 family protein [Oceanicoccus sagamiensis]|uniref:DUF924 domain-containing protein n=1 Tax=Oceanicoccus sagamiensis TaxID=716816 RepID=A0A1X9N9B4_9GAMM|nr:DUF924 family protein [Oceanicoccus sagamiensis]ARN74256.1 hypothetical protein BST96_09065 [Oceanicoccus sagamiensis]
MAHSYPKQIIFKLLFCWVLLLAIAPQSYADGGTANAIPPTAQQRQAMLDKTDPEALRLLKFWYEEWDQDKVNGGKGKYNDKWFPHGPKGAEGSKAVDAEIRKEFLDTFNKVLAKEIHWDINHNPYENLAYVLLFDQLTRNMFRGTEKAYENDQLALDAVKINLANHFSDYYFTGYQKLFLVYPLMHHENITSQSQSLAYLKAINEHPEHRYEFLNALQKGVEHYQVILMFNRFPHRNVRQDRKDTVLEAAYLAKKGTAGFVDGSKW